MLTAFDETGTIHSIEPSLDTLAGKELGDSSEGRRLAQRAVKSARRDGRKTSRSEESRRSAAMSPGSFDLPEAGLVDRSDAASQ
jgi:hypothetical protein